MAVFDIERQLKNLFEREDTGPHMRNKPVTMRPAVLHDMWVCLRAFFLSLGLICFSFSPSHMHVCCLEWHEARVPDDGDYFC